MRVIAGTARRLPLIAPEGKDTRPTTDRIKETLFNIIQDDGSGAIGIEALSRGAKQAYLVEFGKEPLRCIKANLAKTHLEDQAVVLPVEVTYAVSKLEKQGTTFDIIYADPPYRSGFEEKLAQLIGQSDIVKEDTLVIFESALETPIDFIDEDVYEIEKVKEYKTNKHIFLRVKKER